MESPIFNLDSVSLSYRFKPVVQDLSLSLGEGRCLGVLGSNGAGKTTMVRAILGMIRPLSGSVTVLGYQPGSTQCFRELAYVPEEGSAPEFLSPLEYLKMIRSLYRLESKSSVCDEEIGFFELDPHKKIRQLSKGNRRRLLLAAAFMVRPRFLILDEPINGLDPMMVIKLRQRLQDFCAQGSSILICSHILSEVEKVCSDIAILKLGRKVYSGTVAAAEAEYGGLENAFAKLAGAAT